MTNFRETKAGYVVTIDNIDYFCNNIKPTKVGAKYPITANISRMEKSDEGNKFVHLSAPKDLQIICKVRKVLVDNLTLNTNNDII